VAYLPKPSAPGNAKYLSWAVTMMLLMSNNNAPNNFFMMNVIFIVKLFLLAKV
jgi:hypothetical protein